MAAGKKVGMFAALGAALGALLFWRKKKKSGADMGASVQQLAAGATPPDAMPGITVGAGHDPPLPRPGHGGPPCRRPIGSLGLQQ